MNFNFIVPQSPAGAVPALYCVPPNVTKSHTTPFSFFHPKFKTELCNKYDPVLGCPYGDQCQFRHPEDPHPSQPNGMKSMPAVQVGRNRFANHPPSVNADFRRRNPSFSSQYNNGRQGRSPTTTTLSYIHPKFKTEECNKYGSVFGCPYGDQCQFRHPEDPHPSQVVMKKISQITITEGGTMGNGANNTTTPFGMPMAGRGGGRFFGRSNGVGGDFRRRNPSYNSQPFHKEKLQNNKFVNSNPKAIKTQQNRDFLEKKKEEIIMMYDIVSKDRIMKEMERIKENCPTYIKNFTVDEKDLRKWTLTIVPDFAPYKGSQLRFEVEFPDEYPFKPPHIAVLSPIYHPNVTSSGEVCLSVIQADNWKPAVTCTAVFDSLLYLLRFPEPELVGPEPIALQYMHDRALYMKTAAEKSEKQ